MYSGTTITKYSGLIMGAHQKIDRLARKHITLITNDKYNFPSIRMILNFEGKNGPDAIKRKSPAQDEPWHYFDPFDEEDIQLTELIMEHYQQLVKELQSGNNERSAFEAAWLSHALVDGLTPAHHYPYEEKLIELRGGEGIESRTTIKKKLVMTGETKREQVKNNWKMWGPKGLMTTHGFFEFGVAAIIAPITMKESIPSRRELKLIQEIGLEEWFRRVAREIAILDLYQDFYKKGWTPTLAWKIRHKLGPMIVQTVTLAWYIALIDAGIIGKQLPRSRKETKKALKG